MPISTEGSDMPTTRPNTGSLVYMFSSGVGELFPCLYPLKVQACPPRDQIPALRLGSRGSGTKRVVITMCYLVVLLVLCDKAH